MVNKNRDGDVVKFSQEVNRITENANKAQKDIQRFQKSLDKDLNKPLQRIKAIDPYTGEYITTEEFRNAPGKYLSATIGKNNYEIYDKKGDQITGSMLDKASYDDGLTTEEADEILQQRKASIKFSQDSNDLMKHINEVDEKLNAILEKSKTRDELIENIKAGIDKDDYQYVVDKLSATDENGDTNYNIKLEDLANLDLKKELLEKKESSVEKFNGDDDGGDDGGDTPQPPQTSSEKDKDASLSSGGKENSPLNLSSNDLKMITDFGDDVDKELEESEQTTGHKFYSRIFSVPEWFPKGLEEFREAKRKYTSKAVYDSETGKYEMGTGSYGDTPRGGYSYDPNKPGINKMRKNEDAFPFAEKEMKMAQQVVNGIEKDIKKQEKYNAKSDTAREEKSKAQYEKHLDEYNKIKENYDVEVEDIDNEIKKIHSESEKWAGSNAEVREVDRLDRVKRLEELENRKQKWVDFLREKEDELRPWKEQYEKFTNKDVLKQEKEAIEAIKNGNLADANKEVDRLKKIFEGSQEKFQSDKEEYRAAKRKILKENVGNIARNMWFIIDLVMTMNRNYARLLPKGKYSPNLGNFETPALFQDYAEQLNNMRDSYNKVNTQAAEGRVASIVGRSLGATEAINTYMKNVAQKDYDIFKGNLDSILYKQRRWSDNDVQKDFAGFLKKLDLDYSKHKFNQDLVLAFQTAPDFLKKLSMEDQRAWVDYIVATSKNDQEVMNALLKKLALGIGKNMNAKEQADAYKDLIMSAYVAQGKRSISDDNTQMYTNQIKKIRETIQAGQDAESLIANTIADIATGGVTSTIRKTTTPDGGVTTTTQENVRGRL